MTFLNTFGYAHHLATLYIELDLIKTILLKIHIDLTNFEMHGKETQAFQC